MPSVGPGAGASLWTPTDLPGFQSWWDFTDRSTVAISGTTVTGWRARSGQVTTTASSGTPTLATINGFPAVRFNGASLTTNDPVGDTTSSAFGVIVLGSNGNYSTPFGAETSGSLDYCIMTVGGVWHVSKDAVADVAVYSGTLAAATPYVLSVVMNGSTVTFGVNGVFETQTQTQTLNAGYLKFGLPFTAVASDCTVGAFVKCSEAVPMDLARRVVAALAHQWRIPLPGGSGSPPLVFT